MQLANAAEPLSFGNGFEIGAGEVVTGLAAVAQNDIARFTAIATMLVVFDATFATDDAAELSRLEEPIAEPAQDLQSLSDRYEWVIARRYGRQYIGWEAHRIAFYVLSQYLKMFA